MGQKRWILASQKPMNFGFCSTSKPQSTIRLRIPGIAKTLVSAHEALVIFRLTIKSERQLEEFSSEPPIVGKVDIGRRSVDEERVRYLREAAEVLLTHFRTVAMYKSLEADAVDRLNFFRVYNGCLMDVAVISWCKIMGTNGQVAHWTRLFPDLKHDEIRVKLHAEAGSPEAYESIWEEAKIYRNQYLAHHVFDEEARPKRHPILRPLFRTSAVIYKLIFEELAVEFQEHGLPPPTECDDEQFDHLVTHWAKIAEAAREATTGFKNTPDRQ